MAGCSVAGPAGPTPSGSNASPSQQPPTQSSSLPPPATQDASGLTGRTVVDGGCPVEVEGSPCPAKPLAARITIVLADTRAIVTVVTSDVEGHFRVGLSPGSYVLNAVNLTGAPYPRSSPVDVVVHAGSYTPVKLSFDSGIQ